MANSDRIEHLKRIFRQSFHTERAGEKQSVQDLAESYGLTDIMNMIIVNRFGCESIEELSLGELSELSETLHTLHSVKAANTAPNVVSFPSPRGK
ncbi:MAG: hypothetical protein AAGF81_07005 [Pseudomonadota bacterium]